MPSSKVLRFFDAETQSPQSLTQAQVTSFNREGFLAPLDLFSPAEATEIRYFFNRLMAQAVTIGWDRYTLVNFELYCASIYDWVMDSRILDMVEDLLGPHFVCVGTHFFRKSPGDIKRVAWHQDAPYYELSPSKSLTAWLAIDDVDEENAAMQVIPCSHRHGEIKMTPSAGEEQNVLTQTVREPQAYGEPVSINLRAGQISLHSDMLLHGSEPNASARRRCGLAIRYVPTDVRALTDWNRLAIQCRGTDVTGHWHHNPRPKNDCLPVRPADGKFWSITETVPLQTGMVNES